MYKLTTLKTEDTLKQGLKPPARLEHWHGGGSQSNLETARSEIFFMRGINEYIYQPAYGVCNNNSVRVCGVSGGRPTTPDKRVTIFRCLLSCRPIWHIYT